MPASTLPDRWADAVGGDRDAFEAAVAPYQGELMRAAERLLKLSRDAGRRATPDDLTPEELAGETLVSAFESRAGFDPARSSFRAWLLGGMRRALDAYLRQEDGYADRKALSIDDPLPTGVAQDANGDHRFEEHQPLEVMSYADLIPDSSPVDVEFDMDEHSTARLSPGERAYLADNDLDESERIALFHDEFDLSIEETAQIFEQTIRDTEQTLNVARVRLRERLGPAPAEHGPGAPADDASDDVDSYTGDKVR